jgi:predicted HicB family RNase H-like nuclease
MARPKHPRGNTSPRRYTGGRPRTTLRVRIDKESMRTLRLLANASGTSIEERAAVLLTNAIEQAWQAYDEEIQRVD